jgi:hypothetical protein
MSLNSYIVISFVDDRCIYSFLKFSLNMMSCLFRLRITSERHLKTFGKTPWIGDQASQCLPMARTVKQKNMDMFACP